MSGSAHRPADESPAWRDLTDGAPMPEMIELESAELLDELAHRVRGPLLRQLRTPRSAAELAADLDVPVTRLYHHLKVLESAGMIEVVALRQVGSAQERRYRATARSFRIRPDAIDQPADLARSLAAVLDSTRLDLVDVVERGAGDDVDMWSLRLQLSPEDRSELTERMRELFDEFIAREAAGDDDQELVVLALAFLAEAEHRPAHPPRS